VDRFLSRAQKGLTKSRFIQEVIINIMETMEYSKKRGIKGVLVSIDQSKAFDSVSHDYMEKVYDFFGFGERIKKWLKTIGTGRTASVELSDTSTTETFDLGKGHAQRDSPSPLLYNIAAQIIIFKIELDPNIQKICETELDPPVNLIPQLFFKGEGFGKTTNNESFADDSSNLMVLTVDSLNKLRIILDEFRILSGLSCNLEKSFAMRIGDCQGPITDDKLNTGFSFVDKIKLLGFTLQNYGDVVAANFEVIAQKIENISRFWERFRLSLNGKIAVYKSLMLPQINYAASIFTPDNDMMIRLEQATERFVSGGLNIAKSKLYTAVDRGGVGMFRLDDFISSLQCSWIKRCHNQITDNWRFQLAQIGNNNVLNIVYDNHARSVLGTVLSNITKSYDKFKEKYAQVENNYLKVPIYCNNAFGYGRGIGNRLDENFFETDNNTQRRDLVMKITWSDLSAGGNFLSKHDVETHVGLTLTNNKYGSLKNAYQCAVNKYHSNGKSVTDISTFLSSFKKGSKRFRLILGTDRNLRNITNSQQVKTFMRLIDCAIPEELRTKTLFCSWNKSYMSSNINMFKFKFYNNILGLNSRVAHFNNEIDAGCTFCKITGPFPVPSETFVHIFFDYPSVYKIIQTLYSRYFLNQTITKENYFLANYSEIERDNLPINILLDLCRYLIWQEKLGKKLPSATTMLVNLDTLLAITVGSSRKLEEQFSGCLYFQNGGNQDDYGNGRRP
jgi:hypothetical protein